MHFLRSSTSDQKCVWSFCPAASRINCDNPKLKGLCSRFLLQSTSAYCQKRQKASKMEEIRNCVMGQYEENVALPFVSFLMYVLMVELFYHRITTLVCRHIPFHICFIGSYEVLEVFLYSCFIIIRLS